ncbi:MAG: sugar ABC transporter substrate-binding protein [Propionicimonas sp.]
MKRTWQILAIGGCLMALTACGSVGGGTTPTADPGQTGASTGTQEPRKLNLDVPEGSLKDRTICFNFQALETEFWAAGKLAISEGLAAGGGKVLEFNSNEDANRQLEQIKDCITQNADGIIFIPQDGASADTVIKTANEANVPVVAFNRPPASDTGKAIVVVADNRAIAKATVDYLVSEARKQFEATGKKLTPLVMVGDLADVNAVDRRDGFYDAMKGTDDIFEKVIEVETKWDATTAQQNLQSALQANPNVDLIFTSSDFMYPQIQAVLSPLGKWKPVGEEGHVILGGLDGDNRACNLMREKFVDATGVQDLLFEAQESVTQLTAAIDAGDKQVDKVVNDAGFALTLANMGEREKDMWGCVIDPPQ